MSAAHAITADQDNSGFLMIEPASCRDGFTSDKIYQASIGLQAAVGEWRSKMSIHSDKCSSHLKNERLRFLFGAIILTVLASLLAGCGSSDETTATIEENALTRRAADVFSSAGGSDSEYPDNTITAEELYAKLQDPAEAATLSLLDTRPAVELSAQGAIPGSLWIQMQQVVNPDSLAKIPADKTIVCISPTGHTANQVASTLRWLGWDAILLKYGMGSWTQTPAGVDITKGDVQTALQYPFPIVGASGEATETIAASGKPLAGPPNDDYSTLQQVAQDYMNPNVFEQEYPFHNISAQALYDRLADPVLRDETYLLDIRTPATYDSIGHIDGTVNIPWRELGDPENLGQLPEDKMIVVVGNNGRDSGQVTAILIMLGYNAVTLRSGMAGWVPTPESEEIIDAVDNANYPVVPAVGG